LGQAYPPEERTAKAAAANRAKKGRPPKWASFVNIADDILAKKPGWPPKHASKKAKGIHPVLVEKLKEHAVKTGQRIKPPSERTLRDYIGKMKVGKQRT
jgi:hypothetical protein